MVDVSGSVSDDELKLIYSHLKTFVKDKKNEVQVDVFFWSSGKVKKERDFIEDISNNNIDGFSPYSYGGTQLEYASDFINENYEGKKIIFVNITDGYFNAIDLNSKIVESHCCVLTVRNMENEMLKMFQKREVPVNTVVTIRNERSGY